MPPSHAARTLVGKSLRQAPSIHHVAGHIRWDLPMRDSPGRLPRLGTRGAGKPRIEAVEVEKDYGRRVKGQRLADYQPADNGVAEQLADLGSCAGAEHQWNAAEERGHRRHHDWAEAQQARLTDRVHRRETATALGSMQNRGGLARSG